MPFSISSSVLTLQNVARVNTSVTNSPCFAAKHFPTGANLKTRCRESYKFGLENRHVWKKRDENSVLSHLLLWPSSFVIRLMANFYPSVAPERSTATRSRQNRRTRRKRNRRSWFCHFAKSQLLPSGSEPRPSLDSSLKWLQAWFIILKSSITGLKCFPL